MTQKQVEFLTARQASQLLHTQTTTLERWEREGFLSSVAGSSNKLLYSRAEILSLRQNLLLKSRIGRLNTLELLRQLSGLLSSISSYRDKLSLGQTVVNEAAKLLSSQRCSIYLLDEAGSTLEPFTAIDTKEPERIEIFYRIPIQLAEQTALAQILLKDKKSIHISDTYNDSRNLRPLFEQFKTRAIIITPLKDAQGNFFGILNFTWGDGPHLFTDEELVFAEALADQTSIAFENVRFTELSQANSAFLEAVIESAAQGIVVYDNDSRILLANQKVAQLYDLTKEEIINITSAELGRKIAAKFTSSQDLTLISQRIENKSPESYVDEIEFTAPRHLVIQRLVTPVYDTQNHLLGKVALYRDLTQEREISQIKDDFISLATHELKTPLTALTGYAQRLFIRLQRQSEEADQFVLENSQRIYNQAFALNDLMNDLLDISRLTSEHFTLQIESFDVVQLLNYVVEQVQATTTKHQLNLNLEEFPETQMLQGDKRQIERVVRNLLENAVKYSPKGGPVEVTASFSKDIAADTPPCITIAVRDKGIGIEATLQNQLFQKFYRTPKAIEVASGLGLGLAICAEIIRQHGGQIWVESPGENQGSTFGFSLTY